MSAQIKVLPSKKRPARSKLRTLKGKLNRHVDDAIHVALTLMNDSETPPASKLKAAIWLVDKYVSVHKDIIEEEYRLNDPLSTEIDNSDDEEEAPAKPRFSMTMLED